MGRMDDIAVRVVALVAVLAPMAVSDIRHRSVPTRMVYAGYMVAAALLVYGALDGTLAAGPDAGTLAMILGCAAAGLMILAGRILGVLLGEADGHVLAVSSLVVPWHGDIPVTLYGVAAGCAAAALRLAAANITYNISDMLSGRPIPFDVDFFACHRKRRGERFAVARTGTTGGLGVDEHGDIRTASGRRLFEPVNSEGQVVRGTAPMVPYLMAGVCGTLAYALGW